MREIVQSRTVVCCAEIQDTNWRWIEANLADTGLTFEFARCFPQYTFERKLRFNIARVRGAFKAVQFARRGNSQVVVIVAHGPTLAAWCALFARIYNVDTPIIAHTFNFTELPSSLKRYIFAAAFSRIRRFIVFPTMERDLYAKAFRQSIDRFDVVLWGVQKPKVDAPEIPLESGPYVCAIGGNGRDYSVFVESARRLPDIRFVLVARPQNIVGLPMPFNLKVHTDIPVGRAMNILLHSRFMVLPLLGSQVPCGHVTLVSAMQLGKAIVITDSAGVRDYIRNGENALTVLPGSVETLVTAIRRLWTDPNLCAQLGENGRKFSSLACTEENIVRHFRDWLQSNVD